jgi:hypothetical protein
MSKESASVAVASAPASVAVASAPASVAAASASVAVAPAPASVAVASAPASVAVAPGVAPVSAAESEGRRLNEYEPAKILGQITSKIRNSQGIFSEIYKSKPPSSDHDPLNFYDLFTEIAEYNEALFGEKLKTKIFAANITARFAEKSKQDGITDYASISDHEIYIKRTTSSKQSEEKFILTLFDEDNNKIEVILDFSDSKDEAKFSLTAIIEKINEIKVQTDGSKPIKKPNPTLLKKDEEGKPQFFLSIKKPSAIIKYKLTEDLDFSWYEHNSNLATEKKIDFSGNITDGETLGNLEDHDSNYSDLKSSEYQTEGTINSVIFCANQNFSPIEQSVNLVLVSGSSDPKTTYLDAGKTITLESKLAKIKKEKEKSEEFLPKTKDDHQSKLEDAAEKIKRYLRKTYISRIDNKDAKAITAKFSDLLTGRYIDRSDYKKYKTTLEEEYLIENDSTSIAKKKQKTLSEALSDTIDSDSEYSKKLNEGNLLQGTDDLQTKTEYQDFVAITSFEGSSGFSKLSQSVQSASLSNAKPLYNIAKISDFPEEGSAPIYCLTSLTQSETDQNLLNKTFLDQQEADKFLEETKKENKEIYELCLEYEKSLTRLKAYEALYQKKIIELQEKREKTDDDRINIGSFIDRLSKLEKIALGGTFIKKKSKYWQDVDLKDKTSLQEAMAKTIMDPIGAYEDNFKVEDIKKHLQDFSKEVEKYSQDLVDGKTIANNIEIDLEKLSEEEIARAKMKTAKFCNQRMQEKIEENLQKYSVLFTQVEELNETSARDLSAGSFYGHDQKKLDRVKEFLQEPFPNSAFGCERAITISRVKSDNNAVKIIFNNPKMDTAWIDLGNGCFAKVLVGNGTESKTFYEPGMVWRTRPTSRVLAKGEIIIDQSIYVKNSDGQFYPTGDTSAYSINALKADMGQGSFSFETVALKFQNLKIDAISIDENQHLNGRLIQFEGKKLESTDLQKSGNIPTQTLEHQREEKEVYDYYSHQLKDSHSNPLSCFISFCTQTQEFEKDEFGFKFYSDAELKTPFEFDSTNTREELTKKANKVKSENIPKTTNPVKKETDKKTYFFQINPEETDDGKKVYVCIGENNKFFSSANGLQFYSKSPNDKMEVKTDLDPAEKTKYEQIAKNALFKISKDKFLKAEEVKSSTTSPERSDAWTIRAMKEFSVKSGGLGGNGR